MTELTKQIQDELAQPFPDSKIKWLPKITTKKGANGQREPIKRNGIRVAGCMAHIDARDVMERLDSVVGAGNWYDRYQPSAIGKGVECALTVLGVTKVDVGIPSDTEPEKGAYSDALKRAAVKFGIGRHLYDIDTQWLPFDGYKVIKKHAQQNNPAPKQNGNAQTLEPLPDDEQVILETSQADYIKSILALIDRYDNAYAIKNAFKKLGVTKVSGNAQQRLKDYRKLKAHAKQRNSEEKPIEQDPLFA